MNALNKLKDKIRIGIARQLQDCQEIVPLASHSMDKALTISERINLRLHLAVCLSCQRYLQQLQFLRETAQEQGRQVNAAAIANPMPDEVRARLQERLAACRQATESPAPESGE